jgi:rhomboid family GlyGly-CTERM serine protease
VRLLRIIPLRSTGTGSRRPGHPPRPRGGNGWRGAGSLPLVTLLLAASAVLFSLWPGAAQALQWERAAVLAGEEWRLLTGHLVHFGAEHLAYDVVALVLLGAACERRGRAVLVGTLVVSALAIPAVVASARPDLGSYRGLSGLDAALFALLLARLVRESAAQGARLRTGGLLLVGALFAVKLAVEFSGVAVFVDTGAFLPVPEAHAAGALVGLAFGVAARAAGSRRIAPSSLTRTQRMNDPSFSA